jgi:hypothetical protein
MHWHGNINHLTLLALLGWALVLPDRVHTFNNNLAFCRKSSDNLAGFTSVIT